MSIFQTIEIPINSITNEKLKLKRSRLIFAGKTLIVLMSILIVLCLIRIKPEYVIFGYSGCAPELIQVTNNEIRVDTNYYMFDKQSAENVKLNGCQFYLKGNDLNQLKLKIPLIMIIDFRNHFGGPNSFGRQYFLEFKVLGIKRQYLVSEPKKSIYYPDLGERISEKINEIESQYGDICLRKEVLIECD